MKYIIITALSIFCIAACTNHHGAIRTEEMNDGNTKTKIVDDGKTMSMKVKIKNVENPVDYAKIFDVRNMSDKQKQTLKDHVLDSLYKLNK
jgi:hypothetical protein